MEMIQKKIPTFLDIYWTVIIREILGWNKDYDELMKEKEFLEKLKKRPEKLSHKEIKEYLLKFLNKWGCRIKKEEYNTVSEKLKDFFEKYRGKFFEGECLLSFNFRQYKERLIKILKELNDINEVGPTAMSKILHILNPRLFVMWDMKIAEGLGFEHSEEGYLKFLQEMQKYAKNINETYRIRMHSSEESIEIFLNKKLGLKIKYTLTKFIDEYNWIKYTKKGRLPTDWKEAENLLKEIYCMEIH